MDKLIAFFEDLKTRQLTRGQLQGFLYVMVANRISRADGEAISSGMGWRELAGWLKKVRWDIDAVRELGLDPEQLPPRDRQRFWFTAITHALLDTDAARAGGVRFIAILQEHGYAVK